LVVQVLLPEEWDPAVLGGDDEDDEAEFANARPAGASAQVRSRS
jgi:hypothetical protein